MHTCTCSMMYLGVHTAVRVPLGTGGDTAHVSGSIAISGMNHIIISHTKFSDTKDKSFQIYPQFGTFTWRCAKSFEVLTLIFSTDCSPIDWLQSVLKITRFEYVFFFFFFWKSGVAFAGWNWISMVPRLKLLIRIRLVAGRIISYSQPFGRIATFWRSDFCHVCRSS